MQQTYDAPMASIEMYVCPDSGALATQYCPEAELKLFVPGTEPKEIYNPRTVFNGD